MPLSWNEIRHRAIAFSKEWMGATREQADKQIFWNVFFNVFGVPRRAVASFEEPVKNLSGDYGYIDLFWPGKVLVEHKSRGKDLAKPSRRRSATFRTWRVRGARRPATARLMTSRDMGATPEEMRTRSGRSAPTPSIYLICWGTFGNGRATGTRRSITKVRRSVTRRERPAANIVSHGAGCGGTSVPGALRLPTATAECRTTGTTALEFGVSGNWTYLDPFPFTSCRGSGPRASCRECRGRRYPPFGVCGGLRKHSFCS